MESLRLCAVYVCGVLQRLCAHVSYSLLGVLKAAAVSYGLAWGVLQAVRTCELYGVSP